MQLRECVISSRVLRVMPVMRGQHFYRRACSDCRSRPAGGAGPPVTEEPHAHLRDERHEARDQAAEQAERAERRHK